MKYKLKIPARYVLAILGLFGTFTKYILKVNQSVAIVVLVDFDSVEPNFMSGNLTLTENQTDGNLLRCSPVIFDNFTVNGNETKYKWTASQQGLVLASYSYGEITSQVGMTFISRQFGPVRVVGISALLASVLTLLIPIVTEALGLAGLVATRVLVGVLVGASLPQIVGLAGKWSPPQERSRIISIVFAGAPLGISCCLCVGGILAATLGWKSVFYATGTFGASWAILWMVLVYETPDDHPRISVAERLMIKSSLERKTPQTKDVDKVPWLKMLSSGPLASIHIAYFCSLYGRQALSSMLPTYFKTVQNVGVTMSGMLTAIPFATAGLLGIVSGKIADELISKGYRVITVRKAYTAIGMSISAISVVSVGYTGCNLVASVTMATLVVAMDALAPSGFKGCCVDLAPHLSGIIISIGSTLAFSTGFIAPQVTGALREAYGFRGWQISFWIGAGLYLAGMVQFMIFGTNEEQSWATQETSRRASIATVEGTVER